MISFVRVISGSGQTASESMEKTRRKPPQKVGLKQILFKRHKIIDSVRKSAICQQLPTPAKPNRGGKNAFPSRGPHVLSMYNKDDSCRRFYDACFGPLCHFPFSRAIKKKPKTTPAGRKVQE